MIPRQLADIIAKEVGLPLAVAVKLFLQGKIQQRGMCIPTDKAIYEPVLNELTSFGIEYRKTLRLSLWKINELNNKNCPLSP